MKEVIIVNCFLNNRKKEEVAINCIRQLKKTGFDVMVVSHYDIPYSVRALCDFYIYDKNNTIITEQTDYYSYETDSLSWKVKTPHSAHSYAALTSIKNGVYLCKSMGYDFFHHIEYDVILSDSDINILKNLSKNLEDKYGYFDLYNLYSHYKGISMLYFSCYVDEFIKTFDIPNNKKSYLDGSFKRGIVASENFLFDSIKDNLSNFKIGDRSGISISLFKDKESEIGVSNYFDEELQFIIDICEDYNNNQNLFLLFFNLTEDPLTLNFDDISIDVNYRVLYYHQIFNRNRSIEYSVLNKKTNSSKKSSLDISKILLDKNEPEFFKFK